MVVLPPDRAVRRCGFGLRRGPAGAFAKAALVVQRWPACAGPFAASPAEATPSWLPAGDELIAERPDGADASSVCVHDHHVPLSRIGGFDVGQLLAVGRPVGSEFGPRGACEP